MNLLSLGFTAAYRRVEQKIADSYRSAKNAAIARHYAKATDERRNAAINLLLDDAKFHGVNPASLLGAEHEESGYRSCIGEDFPDDY
jgi:hypothetical protein